MALDICSIVDTLTAFQVEVLRRINKKFLALQNLAALLEQLGDINSFIPNLSVLPPINQIDLSTYQRLAAACPFLKLPNATASLNQLQAAVVAAYNELFQGLRRSPFSRMGKLQQEMLDFQSKITAPIGEAGVFLQCLQNVCAAGAAVSGQLQKLGTSNVSKEVATFTQNFVTNGGKVLTDTMQNKVNDVVSAQNQLRALGADVKLDYTTAKAAKTK